jgi:hypothetical protein
MHSSESLPESIAPNERIFRGIWIHPHPKPVKNAPGLGDVPALALPFACFPSCIIESIDRESLMCAMGELQGSCVGGWAVDTKDGENMRKGGTNISFGA